MIWQLAGGLDGMLGWVNPDREQLWDMAKLLVPGITVIGVIVLLLVLL